RSAGTNKRRLNTTQRKTGLRRIGSAVGADPTYGSVVMDFSLGSAAAKVRETTGNRSKIKPESSASANSATRAHENSTSYEPTAIRHLALCWIFCRSKHTQASASRSNSQSPADT